jgi:hypothetical protein
MANATRMRSSQGLSVYHRVPADGDMATKDIATSDEDVIGLGGKGDFEIEADADVTYTDASKVAVAGTGGVPIAGSDAIGKFLYIKHSGFTTALKTVATTQLLKYGVGDPDVIGFTLAPGESVLLHGLGTSVDDIANWNLESASGDIYTEVIYL